MKIVWSIEIGAMVKLLYSDFSESKSLVKMSFRITFPFCFINTINPLSKYFLSTFLVGCLGFFYAVRLSGTSSSRSYQCREP